MTSASGDARTAEISTGQHRLRAQVPAWVFSLAVEADEATARARHAAFADRCMPLLAHESAPLAQTRQRLLQQLWTVRQLLVTAGLGYLGALAGELNDRPGLILLGIAAAPLAIPDGIRPASRLATLVRHRHPGAAVEEFPTAHGQGVGVRRCQQFSLPAEMPGTPPTIDTATSQALVPFPEAGLLGTVTAFCFSPDDIDVATIFTATIAYGMTVIADA